MDPQGNLIVGTEPSGLVLKVTPTGQGFVLHQTAKREGETLAGLTRPAVPGESRRGMDGAVLIRQKFYGGVEHADLAC